MSHRQMSESLCWAAKKKDELKRLHELAKLDLIGQKSCTG